MKGKGKWHTENYDRVLNIMQKPPFRFKVREIDEKLRKDCNKKIVQRTIQRALKKMKSNGVVRKEGNYYIYASHDILRDRWLGYFDQIFRALVIRGYTVEDFVNTQGVIITPRNMGFAPADPVSLKRLINALMWNPKVPQGGVVMIARSTGRIEKYAPIDILPKEVAEVEKA